MALTWDTQLKIGKGVIVLNSIIAIASFFMSKEPMPFITGLAFGTIFVLLNFRLMAITLEKAVRMPPHKAQVFAATRYFIRYLITGIVVYISIQADHIHVLGTILGLISIKFVILKTELFNDREFFKKIFTKERRRRNGRFRSKSGS